MKEQKSDRLVPAGTPYLFGGNVLVDPTATVDPTAVIGPSVVIGPGVTIGAGVRLQRCVIMEGASVKAQSFVRSSIVGWSSTVGKWVRMDNTTGESYFGAKRNPSYGPRGS